MILVGNKSDLEPERTVSHPEIKDQLCSKQLIISCLIIINS